MACQSVNPNDGKLLQSFEHMSHAQLDQALVANESDFGLGGSVWTRDEARGQRLASRVDTGMMFVNNIDWADAALPFGGVKHSGYGREPGDMGIQEFVNRKLVRTAQVDAPV